MDILGLFLFFGYQRSIPKHIDLLVSLKVDTTKSRNGNEFRSGS
jgi:hypothetical protein